MRKILNLTHFAASATILFSHGCSKACIGSNRREGSTAISFSIRSLTSGDNLSHKGWGFLYAPMVIHRTSSAGPPTSEKGGYEGES